jgi:DNA recombination protein RmuC
MFGLTASAGIVLILGTIVAFLLAWWLRQTRINELNHQLDNLNNTYQQTLESQKLELHLIKTKEEEARQKAAEAIQYQLVAETELKEKSTSWEKQVQWQLNSIAELKENMVNKQARMDEKQREYQLLQTLLADERNAHETLKARLEEKEQHFADQLKILQENREQLKQDFATLASEVLETKGKVLSEQSQKDITALLTPFREQVNAFKERVEAIHTQNATQQSALKTELGHLKDLNKQITEEAHSLATALRGQKKTQGNWGEMILENVLDRSGLIKDKDYKREVSINNAEGGRARPDVIVYLPEGKHLIIDAKVSLNAYTRFINAEEDTTRHQALAEHVQAFTDRIKELSDRQYFDLPSLNSPEMVFMFVPVESAFVEALKADESLFQKAIEQNVLVATPTTLLTSLNIVRQLWRYENQNKHTAELAEKATKVYDKLRLFMGSLEKVGEQLDRAKDSYSKAYEQLYTGRGNLVKQVSEFSKLGVSVKTELPEHIVEKAELELDFLSEHRDEDNG